MRWMEDWKIGRLVFYLLPCSPAPLLPCKNSSGDGLRLFNGKPKLAIGSAGDGITMMRLHGDIRREAQPDTSRLLALGG